MRAGLLETPAAGRGVESEKAEHQYKASALLLRGLLIFSMFFRIMSCNVTLTEEKKSRKLALKKLVSDLTGDRQQHQDLHIDFGAQKL